MKRFFIKFLAGLNMAEGFIHIAIAIIGLWGCYATGNWDWRLLAAPVENLFFGVFSLLTGYVLGSHAHHHHFPTPEEKK